MNEKGDKNKAQLNLILEFTLVSPVLVAQETPTAWPCILQLPASHKQCPSTAHYSLGAAWCLASEPLPTLFPLPGAPSPTAPHPLVLQAWTGTAPPPGSHG